MNIFTDAFVKQRTVNGVVPVSVSKAFRHQEEFFNAVDKYTDRKFVLLRNDSPIAVVQSVTSMKESSDDEEK